MRSILFRGKDTRGFWHIGLLAHIGNAWYISNSEGVESAFEVIPETIGQYTGLTDKYGKAVFEGDIVTGLFSFGMSIKSVVAFKAGSFGLISNRCGVERFDAFTSICNVEYEVIGNIHDEPELLQE